jgi:hypothetical protein
LPAEEKILGGFGEAGEQEAEPEYGGEVGDDDEIIQLGSRNRAHLDFSESVKVPEDLEDEVDQDGEDHGQQGKPVFLSSPDIVSPAPGDQKADGEYESPDGELIDERQPITHGFSGKKYNG